MPMPYLPACQPACLSGLTDPLASFILGVWVRDMLWISPQLYPYVLFPVILLLDKCLFYVSMAF